MKRFKNCLEDKAYTSLLYRLSELPTNPKLIRGINPATDSEFAAAKSSSK
jgi:hypothetical protein